MTKKFAMVKIPDELYIEAALAGFTDNELYDELDRRAVERLNQAFKPFEQAIEKLQADIPYKQSKD